MEDETNNPTESPAAEPTETPVSESFAPAPVVAESTAVSEPETMVVLAGEAPAKLVETSSESVSAQSGGIEPLLKNHI